MQQWFIHFLCSYVFITLSLARIWLKKCWNFNELEHRDNNITLKLLKIPKIEYYLNYTSKEQGISVSFNQTKVSSCTYVVLANRVESFLSIRNIYSPLSRYSTSRGSSNGLVTVGPEKVKACRSILFTEGIPEVEIRWKVAIFALGD